MTPIEAFGIYNAVKLHFTTDSFDFFKYQGKTRISPESFNVRRDKFVFQKLSRKYNREDFTDLVIANVMHKPKLWSADLIHDDAVERYHEYQKNKTSYFYKFKNEIEALIDNRGSDWNKLLRVSDGGAELFLAFQHKEISIETLIILDEIFGFLETWNREISKTDTLIWPSIYTRIKKYKPFIQIPDIKKYKQWLASHLHK